MKNFKNSKIYKITSPNTKMIYIGSTCRTLKARFSKHKYKYEQNIKNNKYYCCRSSIIFDCKNPSIELIENFPCKNLEELNKREGEIIRKYLEIGLSVNKQIAGRSHVQYNEEMREYINERQRIYNKKNKEKISEKKKIKYEKNKKIINRKITCECGSVCMARGLNRHLKTEKHKNNLLVN